jgi:nucleoid DNA-binding protein
MGKLTEEQRHDIITQCKLDTSNENIERLSKQYNITPRYIYKLCKSDKAKEIEQSITQNNQEFTKKANHIINLIFARLEEQLLNGDKMTISQLSTTLGILYDKSRLENNLSTSNNSININIKVEK